MAHSGHQILDGENQQLHKNGSSVGNPSPRMDLEVLATQFKQIWNVIGLILDRELPKVLKFLLVQLVA